MDQKRPLSTRMVPTFQYRSGVIISNKKVSKQFRKFLRSANKSSTPPNTKKYEHMHRKYWFVNTLRKQKWITGLVLIFFLKSVYRHFFAIPVKISECLQSLERNSRTIEMIRRWCHFKLAEKACCKLEDDFFNSNIM